MLKYIYPVAAARVLVGHRGPVVLVGRGAATHRVHVVVHGVLQLEAGCGGFSGWWVPKKKNWERRGDGGRRKGRCGPKAKTGGGGEEKEV